MLFDDNGELIDKKSLSRGAIALLKSTRSLDKLVKKCVRHPMVIHNNDGELVCRGGVNESSPSRDKKINSLLDSSGSHTLSKSSSLPDISPSKNSTLKQQPAASSPLLSYRRSNTPRMTLTAQHQQSRGSLTRGRSGLLEGSISSSVMENSSSIVPSNYFKDELVATLRRHDSYHRKLVKSGPSFDDSTYGSGLGDSRGSSFFDPHQHDDEDDDDEHNNSDKTTYPLPAIEAFRSAKSRRHRRHQQRQSGEEGGSSVTPNPGLTYRSKIASVLRIEDDYAAKWMKMREKRQQLYGQEQRRQMNKELVQKCRSIILHSEK